MSLTKKQFNRLYKLLLDEIPQTSDVIIWLQGDRFDRGHKVLDLYKNKFSDKILISGNNLLIGDKREGENNISLNEMINFLIDNGVDKKNIIIDDKSMNTKDQAKNIFKTIKRKKWNRIILVGSSYYQPRAFLTFLKELKRANWKGSIINQPCIINLNRKPSGREKTAKLLLLEEFVKVNKYGQDLSLVDDGINYLNKRYV